MESVFQDKDNSIINCRVSCKCSTPYWYTDIDLPVSEKAHKAMLNKGTISLFAALVLSGLVSWDSNSALCPVLAQLDILLMPHYQDLFQLYSTIECSKFYVQHS